MTKLYLRNANDVRRAVRAGRVVRLVQSWCEDAVTKRGPIVIDYEKPVAERVTFGVQSPPPDCLTFFDEPKKTAVRASASIPAAPAPVVKAPSRTHLALRSYALFVASKRGGHK